MIKKLQDISRWIRKSSSLTNSGRIAVNNYDGLPPTIEFLEGSEAVLRFDKKNPYSPNTAAERDWNHGYQQMHYAISSTKWYEAKWKLLASTNIRMTEGTHVEPTGNAVSA